MRYPFQPEFLDTLPEELAELYRDLETTLLEEICSRLKLADQLNEVTVQGHPGAALPRDQPGGNRKRKSRIRQGSVRRS